MSCALRLLAMGSSWWLNGALNIHRIKSGEPSSVDCRARRCTPAGDEQLLAGQVLRALWSPANPTPLIERAARLLKRRIHATIRVDRSFLQNIVRQGGKNALDQQTGIACNFIIAWCVCLLNGICEAHDHW